MLRCLLLALILMLAAAEAALAYVDPGSGMLLWQGLIAAVGAVLVWTRRPWQFVKSLWNRLRRK